MKKWLFYIICTIGIIGIIWSASQQVISIIVGIGSVVPPRMVNQQGYQRHLRGTIETIDKWNPSRTKSQSIEEMDKKINWLLQRYMEETEFKIRYVEVFQNILKKISKAKLVEES